MCSACSVRLRAPLSWSSSHRQTVVEATIGSSQGSSSSARMTPPSGKRRLKNSARPRPTTNWPAIEATVKIAVLTTMPLNRPESKIAR